MTNIGKYPKVAILFEAYEIISKLKKARYQIKFPCLGDSRIQCVSVYSDTTYESMKHVSSQGGQIIFLRGANDKIVPASWQSKILNSDKLYWPQKPVH